MNGGYRARFARWRRGRPFWGGTLLGLAGLVIAVVPLELVVSLGMKPSVITLVGSASAGIVTAAGILSLVRPRSADRFGAVGILFAIVSVVGSLGGFGIGTFLGMLGGSLCIAWVPADAATVDPSTDPGSVPT